MNWDIGKIARVTGGKLISGNGGQVVTGISTDSRTVQNGDLFIPLRGENFNGHDYLRKAVERGAAACLSEVETADLRAPVIRVADTLCALGDLAAEWRRNFALPVVAVTGSSGKTTTKEMLAGILAQTGSGLKTEGNFNNLIGLPHTLFRLRKGDRWAVLEMGMSARGEISRLARIAAPQLGIITNVGPAHLETLHGLDGVARAKGELFAVLPAGGTAIINGDDARVTAIPVANGVRRLFFGTGAGDDVRADNVEICGKNIRFQLILPTGVHPVHLSAPGRHNVHNALAAAAAANALGVAAADIVRGLEAFRPGRGRMGLMQRPDGVTVLEDFYNANPLSVRAALVALDELEGNGRRIAVLGDMLELGAEGPALHRQVGAEAARHADYLLLLGEMAGETAVGALRANMPKERVIPLASHAAAIAALTELLRPGDRVLVKGSRGMKMEQICDALREMASPPAPTL
ncbi:MAG: UDP-N-acetylmuramoyl-tripeptide--D-alanyl-D-alanine ligase [Desulfuromonadales bacterium]